MRTYLLRAPSWMVGLITGTSFAVIAIAVWIIMDVSVGYAVITGLVGGALFGGVFAVATRGQRRGFLSALEHLPESEWASARRAAWRGPVPADPAVREAALQLATQAVDRAHRFRSLLFVVLGLNLVLAVVRLVIDGSLGAVGSLVLWIVLIAGQWYSQRRLRQRIALLR